MNSASGSLVFVSGLVHEYSLSDGSALTALDSVDLVAEPGERVAVVGPSGCGKTTLLHLVAGLITPKSGHVVVDGNTPDLSRMEPRLGLVFQDPMLLPWRTVVRNILLPAEFSGDSRSWPKLTELLRLVRLAEFADRYPDELSGGMRSRVSIARALSLSPGLLLLDEPFGALDEVTATTIIVDLSSVWASSPITPTVLFVTHNIDQAVMLSDRVVVMSPRPGRVVAEIPVRLAEPRTRYTVNEKTFVETTSAVRRALFDQ